MAKNKLDVPLVVHAAIKQLYSAIQEQVGKDPLFIIEIIDQDDFMVRHVNSELYFQIQVIQSKQQSKLIFRITRSPYSGSTVESRTSTSPNVSNTLTAFHAWVEMIQAYNTVGIFPSDPSLKYTLEYFTDYKILDEDADREPFDLDRQEYILVFVQELILFLETENNNNQLDEFIVEVRTLKSDLGSLTKNQTVFRISKVLGHIRKHSVELAIKFEKSKAKQVLMFILKEVSKEAIKEGLKFLVGY
jgi:hypothetical protein